MEMRAYWLWLQNAFGAGSRKPLTIVRRFGSPEEFWKAGRNVWTQFSFITPKELQILSHHTPEVCAAQLAYCESLHIAVLTPDDRAYPELLRQIPDPPCALYVRGELPDMDSLLGIAIVGTRQATEEGILSARIFAGELAACGGVVVSGGALGIDRAAHEGAMQAGGKTVCVLGCGLQFPYLMENAGLRAQIAENGALISEYPPDAGVQRGNFPVRNRLISGLSRGTLVVEAAAKSGSLITARLALEQNRDVFAVPGNIYEERYTGTNALIKLGAKPVTEGQDILEEYFGRFTWGRNRPKAGENDLLHDISAENHGNLPKNSEKNGIQSDLETEFREKYQKVLDELSLNAVTLLRAFPQQRVHVSILQEKSKLSTGDLFAALTELELAGLIESHAGRTYTLQEENNAV